MFSWFNNIRDFGSQQFDDPVEQRNVRLMNIMNLLMLVILIGFSIGIVTYFHKPKMLPIVLTGVVATCGYYVLLKKATLWITKTYFCILPTAFVALISVIGVGEGGIDKYYLIICSILPLILFHKKAHYAGLVLFVIIAFFVADYLQTIIEPMFALSEEDEYVYSRFNLFAIFALLYLFLKLFKQEIFNHQQEIETQKALVEEKQNEIVDSITYAKRIQEAILPPDKVVKEVIDDGFILYMPKDIVAGDFYWTEKRNGWQMFAAADCTGHGVPGAMVSVICSNAINRAVNEFELTEPGSILDKTKELVVRTFEKSEQEVKDGMDVALCCWNKGAGILKYAGAHNPLWIIRKAASEVEVVKADRQAIGNDVSTGNFKSNEIFLEEGDTGYVFSDGFQDQFGGEKGKKYKTAKFKKYLLSIQELPMLQQHESLRIEFDNWRGDLEQVDDVCVIGVRV